MRKATCVRGALLIVLLVLTSFAGSVPQALAASCATICCRCLNRCEVMYQNCLSNATTEAESLDCYWRAEACDQNCETGAACGGI